MTLSVIEIAINMGPVFTTPGTSHPTLFELCLGSLTSHISLNMEGIVKQSLWYIVLIQRDLKV